MKTIEVRELKERLSEILDWVQEQEEAVEITNNGEAIALLIPVLQPSLSFKRPEGDIWADMDRLTTEISARWPKDVSAVDAVREVGREL